MWWPLWMIVVPTVGYLLIVALKDIIAYMRCKYYESQGFAFHFAPIIGSIALFMPDPKKDKSDHLGTWRRVMQVCSTGPGLVINDWEQSKAHIWLTDRNLIDKVFEKEISSLARLQRHPDRLPVGFFWKNDETSLQVRQDLADLLKPEIVDSFIPILHDSWKSLLLHAVQTQESTKQELTVDMKAVAGTFWNEACNRLLFGESQPFPVLKETGKELVKEINDLLSFLNSAQGNFHPINMMLCNAFSKYDLTPVFIEASKKAEAIKIAVLDYYKSRIEMASDALEGSLLDLMAKKFKETNQKTFSPEQVLDSIFAFLLAGLQPVMNGITGCLLELAMLPDIAKEILKEAQSQDLTSTMTSSEAMSQPAFLDAFVKEVLRIHSPVPFLYERTIVCDFAIGDYSFKRGDLISIPLAMLNQTNTSSPRKDSFDISNFSNPARSKQFTSSPYSIGKRQCLGKHLADLILKVVVTATVETCDLSPNIGKHPAVWYLNEGYGLKTCFLKCTPRVDH